MQTLLLFVTMTAVDAHLRFKYKEPFDVDLNLELDQLSDGECSKSWMLKFKSSLPKVLIVGDSVSGTHLGYFNETTEHLKGVAETFAMHHLTCPQLFNSSVSLLSMLPFFLKEMKFDVISFNWGHHDILNKRYGPVSLDLYVKNMEALFKMLSKHLKPGGKILWESTTPVPPGGERKNKDAIKINKAAAELWSKYPEVYQNDLYAFITKTICSEPCYPTSCTCDIHVPDSSGEKPSVHFVGWVNRKLGILIASKVKSLLQLPASPAV